LGKFKLTQKFVNEIMIAMVIVYLAAMTVFFHLVKTKYNVNQQGVYSVDTLGNGNIKK